MTGFDYFKLCVTDKYATFEGRARRAEFWYFLLFNIIFNFVFLFLSLALVGATDNTVFFLIYLIYSVLIIIPSIAVCIRRLHDTNRSGWWYLLNFIPFGSIVLLFMYCYEGDVGRNGYGNDPKRPEVIIEFETINKIS
ncbi:DUF805 domain-containing protein [Flavobacterium agricola]|uniref:DUF805 domain-containing protein n=1 Tax=Flavobacterium agricola TaxID=2870839 RepID=A0ABY6LZ90_9FLAO|nr:DUF805 domain-containing protein [Flavobacterium agricola]UYW00475.1 DUF805 domain-containing protein [Flavobacterium agricola]